MRDLGTLGGGFAKAFSINDSSQVTGRADTGGGFGSNFHAFIWDAVNGMRDLGVIAGSSSSGNFINANGHVVGWSSIGTDNRRHAFLHDGTTMHDLGAIGDNDFLSDRSEAYGVNIHDVRRRQHLSSLRRRRALSDPVRLSRWPDVGPDNSGR